MPRRPYQLEFYVDAAGNSPVERWFQDLDESAAYALGSALDGLLQESGPLLCLLRPQYASSLGRGLYEFRLEDVTEGLLRELGKRPRRRLLTLRRKALFRVFFHPHGDRLIILLSAYDKSKRPSGAYQNSQIEIARKRLAEWLARLPPR